MSNKKRALVLLAISLVTGTAAYICGKSYENKLDRETEAWMREHRSMVEQTNLKTYAATGKLERIIQEEQKVSLDEDFEELISKFLDDGNPYTGTLHSILVRFKETSNWTEKTLLYQEFWFVAADAANNLLPEGIPPIEL